MRNEQVERFAHKCEKVLCLKEIKLGEEYDYFSLPFCVLDAVFSIGAHYTSTRNVVERYCKKYGLYKTFQEAEKDYYSNGKQKHTITELIKNIEDCGVDSFASDIIENRQRTSPKSGILKAKAVCMWAKKLQKCGVESCESICKIRHNQKFENEIKGVKGTKGMKKIEGIPGQGSGISLNYFYMLCGDKEQYKCDRHIKGFCKDILEEDIEGKCISEIMRETVEILKKKYPEMNIRLLDYAIWEYHRNCKSQK